MRQPLNSGFFVVLGPWNTDKPVLLRTTTCDNTQNADLRGMIESRREIQPLPRARLPGFSELARSDQGRRLLSLPPPLRGCRTWLPAGSNTRGIRFFCSDRYSNGGCGRTFSIHWDTVIPRCSLLTAQILALMRVVAGGPSTHGAWYFARLSVSISSAYRWVAKWLKLTGHIRSGLCQRVQPPGKADAQSDPFTLNHLSAAFPEAPCAIAALQLALQTAITG